MNEAEKIRPDSWRSMDSALRDGTHILIAFGSDGMSSAIYSRNDDDPHPWKFIDTQGDGRPFLNGARDDEYGPTAWRHLPPRLTSTSPAMNSLASPRLGGIERQRAKRWPPIRFIRRNLVRLICGSVLVAIALLYFWIWTLGPTHSVTPETKAGNAVHE